MEPDSEEVAKAIAALRDLWKECRRSMTSICNFMIFACGLMAIR